MSKPVFLTMTFFCLAVAAICLYAWWRPQDLEYNVGVLLVGGILYLALGVVTLLIFVFIRKTSATKEKEVNK